MAGSGGWPIQHQEMSDFKDFDGDDSFDVNYDFNINELTGLEGIYFTLYFVFVCILWIIIC